MIFAECVVLETRRQIAGPVHTYVRANLNLRNVVVKRTKIDLILIADHIIRASDPLILIEAIAGRSKRIKISAAVGSRKKLRQVLIGEWPDSACRNLITGKGN